MAGPPVTQREREQTRAMRAEGMSRNAIAREISRSVDTVSRHCEDMGLSLDRDAIAAATQAASIKAKARMVSSASSGNVCR
ncbi:hypothetical protein GCM10022254_50280 [Actinomadura meridiana]|uniref:Transposase IS30-like HTH domain-containing protein n=1 Tax=Actinomadura meridiana TaxID=559626 RepID=A0ABP8CCT8_9ACTN